jgi:hypothetical protein
VTLKELKKHLRGLARAAERYANGARLDKYRDRCIGRQMAYLNAAELLEQLDPDKRRIGNGKEEADETGSDRRRG